MVTVSVHRRCRPGNLLGKKLKVQDEVNERGKVEKLSIAWPVSKDPREALCRHSHHQQMVVK